MQCFAQAEGNLCNILEDTSETAIAPCCHGDGAVVLQNRLRGISEKLILYLLDWFSARENLQETRFRPPAVEYLSSRISSSLHWCLAEDKVWTPSCWHIFPQMPARNKESAHAVRRWQVLPKGANVASLLKLGQG